MNIERIVIINHDTHELYIEDVDKEKLENEYHDCEELYIKENYDVTNYSWDYIVDTQYFPEGQSEPIEIEFNDYL